MRTFRTIQFFLFASLLMGTVLAQDRRPASTPEARPAGPPTRAVDEIDYRPLAAMATRLNKLPRERPVNMQGDFAMVMRGKLGADDKFDRATFRTVSSESSDPRLLDIAKDFFESIDSARYFMYLYPLKRYELDIVFKQDAANVELSFQAVAVSESSAKMHKAGFDFLISLKKLQFGRAQTPAEDPMIFENMTATLTNSTVRLTVRIPKSAFHDFVGKQLAATKTSK